MIWKVARPNWPQRREGRQAELATKEADLEGRQAEVATKEADLEGRQAELATKEADWEGRQAELAMQYRPKEGELPVIAPELTSELLHCLSTLPDPWPLAKITIDMEKPSQWVSKMCRLFFADEYARRTVGVPTTAQVPDLEPAFKATQNILPKLEARIIEFLSEWLVTFLMPAKHVLDTRAPHLYFMFLKEYWFKELYLGLKVTASFDRSESYTKEADLEGRQAELATKEADLEGCQTELTTKEADLEGRQAELATKEADLEGRQAELASGWILGVAACHRSSRSRSSSSRKQQEKVATIIFFYGFQKSSRSSSSGSRRKQEEKVAKIIFFYGFQKLH